MSSARQREQLILDHLWIVRYWAKRKRGGGVHFDDLVSIGSFALVQAADSWLGTGSFRNYAFRAIRSAIDRPHSTKNGQYQSLPKSLPQQEPDEDQLESLPSDAPDFLTSDECHSLLSKLPRPERESVRLNYGIGCRQRMTAAQIAKRLRTTEDKVYSLIQSGLLRLRWMVVQRERAG